VDLPVELRPLTLPVEPLQAGSDRVAEAVLRVVVEMERTVVVEYWAGCG
jgi:hypothetical protein